MIVIQWDDVLGNNKSQIDLRAALSQVPKPFGWYAGLDTMLTKAGQMSVDSRFARGARGAMKKVKRSPRARSVGATVGVGAAGIAIAATGGIAGIAMGGAGAIMLSSRLAIVGADHVAFAANKKIWQTPNLGGKFATEMTNMKDRSGKALESIRNLQSMIAGVNEMWELEHEETLQCVSMFCRAMHHQAKWMRAGGNAVGILKTVPLFGSLEQNRSLEKLWFAEVESVDKFYVDLAKAMFKSLLG